jgi:hypothetical protein
VQHIEEMEAGDLLAIKYQSGPDPPTNLVCPITRCLLEDPVLVVETGHTYERRAIEEHFLVNGSTNPLTSKEPSWLLTFAMPLAAGTCKTRHPVPYRRFWTYNLVIKSVNTRD